MWNHRSECGKSATTENYGAIKEERKPWIMASMSDVGLGLFWGCTVCCI